MRIVNIWGLPLRIINWSIAILLGLCFLTAGADGITHMVHVGSGYALSAALIYRIVLGFIGSPTARFTGMIHPFHRFREQLNAFVDYRIQRWTGHSPIGGMTAMVMLFLLGFAAISGMVALNGGDISGIHAAAGIGASLLGIFWLDFTVAYHLFYDRATLRTVLSGQRIVSDDNRAGLQIPRQNSLQINARTFTWAALVSAAFLPLTYVTPDTTTQQQRIAQAFPPVQNALAGTSYEYNEARFSNAVLPEIRQPIFAVNRVNVTWQPSLKAGFDYARPGFDPSTAPAPYMMADETTPDDQLGSIATAAGDETADETPIKRADQ